MDSVQVFILIYYFNLFSNIFHQQLEYFMVKQQTNKLKPKIHTWLEFHKDQIQTKPYFSQTKFWHDAIFLSHSTLQFRESI